MAEIKGGGRLADELADSVWRAVHAMTDTELRSLERRLADMQSDNTSWRTYAIKDALAAFVDDAREHRIYDRHGADALAKHRGGVALHVGAQS